MNVFFVASRAVHYASTLMVLGELVLVFAVARRASHDPRRLSEGDHPDLDRQLIGVAGLGIAASIASGIAWFVAQASAMSGLPVHDALNPSTLALVLGGTTFGRIWVSRLGIVVALCAALLVLRRSKDDRLRLRSRLRFGAVVAAAAYVATLTFVGHAAAGEGADRLARIVVDGVHLLAAGVWVGALPGFALFLGGARPVDVAIRVTRRFSALAVWSVGLLVASGLINAWYLVGSIPALFGTDYGRLLVSKLALFAAMATIAMVNRWYLIPRLASADLEALRSLRRNALLETVLGIAVIAVVGALGITVPAAHETPGWPFARTLSWQGAQEAVWVGAVVGAAAVIACAAAIAVFGGLRSHKPRYWLGGIAGIAVSALTWIWLLGLPAHPTTYAASPVRYTTDSIARGAANYAQNCSDCHGAYGRAGRAPLTQPAGPSRRIDYASYQYPGNLFWSIAHGVAGTAMPGFAPRLGTDDIWALLQFLRAESESKSALGLTDRVDSPRSVAAPDFTFEVAGAPQQSLTRRRGSQPGPALVVLYTLPASQQRLAALATDEAAFAKAGARVIALPLDSASAPHAPQRSAAGGAIRALAPPDVAATYAMFARSSADADADAPRHVEFLVDRQGYLRARWIGVPDAAANQTADILGQLDVLNREPEDAGTASGH